MCNDRPQEGVLNRRGPETEWLCLEKGRESLLRRRGPQERGQEGEEERRELVLQQEFSKC